MIVGGYALAYHGAPRFTGDNDIFMNPDFENAKKHSNINPCPQRPLRYHP